ncbi:Uncharacterised protein [Vibrio cholerae]|nr:Uncharacterised protein [Vibrio cholerae]
MIPQSPYPASESRRQPDGFGLIPRVPWRV